MTMRFLKTIAFHGSLLGILLYSLSSLASNSHSVLHSQLTRAAPNLNPQVLQKALYATDCAVASGIRRPSRLAVIDYSLPSNEKRLWILDLEDGELLLRAWVAHGKNSGEVTATSFSNQMESHQSSLGLFQANESYRGKHGYSLRLDGLEPGFNDQARPRAIVMHGADYADPAWIKTYGRLGRSFGCPAVSRQVIREVVDTLKDGQLVFTYYPDQEWLAGSDFLNCNAVSAQASR